MPRVHQYLADSVLVLHVLFVMFVVGGALLTLVGGYRQWEWVRDRWFRIGHLAAIAFVTVQAWAGLVCPLTTLEMWLRARAGHAHYDGSFIQYWLQRLLYFDAPAWAFALAYTAFGLLVVVAWVRFPPRFATSSESEQS